MGTLVLAERYEILEKIGDGGMAVVYKARDKQLNRFVAIKILKKEFITDQTFVENFIREARAAASLLHPNIVTIYDTGKDRDIYYIVMEYVEGRALSEVISAEAPLDYKRCIRVAKQVASALSLAHRNNIIHRDVKPHNILITPDGTAKITDFGIAKAVSDGTIINDSGVIMGSVHYFSPEQSRGQYVDEKSDIYSLGIVLYEMITGRVPFDADNPVTIAVMHMNDTLIPPSRFVKGVPPGLDQIVLKATAKYQSDRFRTIDEMYKALDNVNFITGVIDDPEIAGYVKPTHMVEENPGQGSSSAAGMGGMPYDDEDAPVEDRYDEPSDAGMYEEPDYGWTSAEKPLYEDEEGEFEFEKKPGFFAGLFGGAKGAGRLNDKQKILLIAAAVVLAVVISIPLSKALVNTFKTETVIVPSAVGLEAQEATELLKEAGLSSVIEIVALPYKAPDPELYVSEDTDTLNLNDVAAANQTPQASDTDSGVKFKEGQVMAQDPAAGMSVKKGETIRLTVAGPPEVPVTEEPDDAAGTEIKEVPDVVGKSKASAEYAISSAGFRIGSVDYQSSDDQPADTVIAQSPKKGDKAPGKSPINIVISSGPSGIPVPNLIGKTSEEAQKLLTNAKLKFVIYDKEARDGTAVGSVYKQAPEAGASVKEGTEVTIAVNQPKITIGYTMQIMKGQGPYPATITITGTGNFSKEVTWKVEGGSASSIDANNGNLTVGAGETATSLTITATSKAYPAIPGKVSVSVGSPPASPTVVGFAISGSWPTYSAINLMSDGSTQAVGATFSISGGGGTATINPDGSGASSGSETSGTPLTITAVAGDGSGRSTTAAYAVP